MGAHWSAARWVMVACLVVALFYLAWQVIDIFLLVFAALLVSLALHSLADPFSRLTGFPERYAVFPVALFTFGAILGAGFLFGSTIQAQTSELLRDLPTAWHTFQSRFHLQQMSNDILKQAEVVAPSGETVLSAIQGLTSNLLQLFVGIFLVVVGGLYFAVDPALYRRLFLDLWPEAQQQLVSRKLDAISTDLRSFLKAQLISMAVVGVLTYIGLAALGIPSALALALFTALAEFVPMVGPVVSAVPALLMALTIGLDSALWTLVVFVGVQQAESNLITPLLQQRMVSLPPAVTLFAVVAFGNLLGPLGILLATPLTVLAFAALRPSQD